MEDVLQNTIWKHFIQRDLTKDETKLVFEIDDEMLSLELKELLNDEINQDYLKLQRKVDLSFVAFEIVENEFIEFLQRDDGNLKSSFSLPFPYFCAKI